MESAKELMIHLSRFQKGDIYLFVQGDFFVHAQCLPLFFGRNNAFIWIFFYATFIDTIRFNT